MSALQTFFNSGGDLEDKQIHLTSLRRAACVLMEAASKGPGLAVDGLCRLAPTEARRLTNEAGFSPNGGWGPLASMLCGSLLEAREAHMTLANEAPPLDGFESSDALRVHLLEAFTQRLIPSTAAASIFISLNLHPAWGLRIAHSVAHKHYATDTDNSLDSESFPYEVRRQITDVVFREIATILEILAACDPTKAYCLDALGNALATAMQTLRSELNRTFTRTDSQGVPPLLDTNAHTNSHRTREFVRDDLMSAVLEPLGICYGFQDRTFTVTNHYALREARVGDGQLEREGLLDWAMANSELADVV